MNSTLLAAAAAALFVLPASAANASLVTADFRWIGANANWSAEGTVLFDDATTPTVTGTTVTGIDSIWFSLLNPDGDPHAAGWAILGGVAQYDWLLATIDPVALTFIGNLQLGVGDPPQALLFNANPFGMLVVNGAVREFGPRSLPLTLRSEPEPEPQPPTMPIPVPGAMALLSLGLMILGGYRANAARHHAG